MHTQMKIHKRLILVISAVGLTIISGLIIFGSNLFNSEPIDFQFHDTYVLIGKVHFLTILFIGILSTLLFVKAIAVKFESLPLNILIIAIFGTLLIFLFVYLNWVMGYESHVKAVYSRDFDKEIQFELTAGIKLVKRFLWILIILSGSILIAASYKTGIKIKKHGHNNGGHS